MNRYVLLIFAALSLFVSGCGNEILPQKEEEKLELSTNEVSFPTAGGTYSVSVTHTSAFSIEVEPAATMWLKAQISGSEDDFVKIRVPRTDEHEERRGRITVKMGTLVRYIDVVQSQKDAIVLDTSDILVECEQGEFTLEIGANVEYTVSIDVPWLRQVESKAYEQGQLKFAYDANPESEMRTAQINIASEDIKHRIFVVQDARMMDYVLKVTHSNRMFALPFITGMKSGTVLWGDGTRDDFKMGIMHEYQSDGEVLVEISMTGSIGEHVVRLDNIESVREIDLSGM